MEEAGRDHKYNGKGRDRTVVTVWQILISMCLPFKGCVWKGFPGSSVVKEFACNAGDPSSMPALGRSTAEGRKLRSGLQNSSTGSQSLGQDCVCVHACMRACVLAYVGRRARSRAGIDLWASLVAQRLKYLPAMWETEVRSLGWEDPLEKEMATHPSILAWRIPWTEEPGGT